MRRLSTLLAIVLLSSGCGVSLVPTPKATSVKPEKDPGVVTLTFDDGRISNVTAARLLDKHGLRGTFFVNSGGINTPGRMTLDDLRYDR